MISKFFAMIWAWFKGLFFKTKAVSSFIIDSTPRVPMPTVRMKRKHPLHHAHFGTFSPIRPWAHERIRKGWIWDA